MIASPDVGIAEYFKEGTYIPILNYRVRRVAESPYDTTIVVGEYDGWSDPPDRSWNVVSSANAILGIAYVHGPPSFTADVSGLTPTQDGNVKSYLVPTEHLPLTQVFRDVGVPNTLVDKADEVLRPVVDAGYVRHDKPGTPVPICTTGRSAATRRVSSRPGSRCGRCAAPRPISVGSAVSTAASCARPSRPPAGISATASRPASAS